MVTFKIFRLRTNLILGEFASKPFDRSVAIGMILTIAGTTLDFQIDILNVSYYSLFRNVYKDNI